MYPVIESIINLRKWIQTSVRIKERWKSWTISYHSFYFSRPPLLCGQLFRTLSLFFFKYSVAYMRVTKWTFDLLLGKATSIFIIIKPPRIKSVGSRRQEWRNYYIAINISCKWHSRYILKPSLYVRMQFTPIGSDGINAINLF